MIKLAACGIILPTIITNYKPLQQFPIPKHIGGCSHVGVAGTGVITFAFFLSFFLPFFLISLTPSIYYFTKLLR